MENAMTLVIVTSYFEEIQEDAAYSNITLMSYFLKSEFFHV